MKKTFIFGHRNPDTDSVSASIALAHLKTELGLNCEPRILSPINPETDYVLKRFNIPVPLYLNDVKVQLKDVNFNKNHIINENQPIINAFNYMNSNGITGLPLVDDNKKFKGYVSLKEIAAEMIYNESLRVDTSFTNILTTLESTDYLHFDDYIRDYAHAVTFDDSTFISDIKLDIGDIFGSSSLLVGAAIVGVASRDEATFDDVLGTTFNLLLDGFIGKDLWETSRWNNNMYEFMLSYTESFMKSFMRQRYYKAQKAPILGAGWTASRRRFRSP